MESVKLSTSEKGDIFEYVNDLYLHLKGQKKKQTKQSFKTSWKEDNMCYILFMALNDAYDKWLQHESNEEWIWERDNIREDKVSKKKHRRIVNMVSEREYELEEELDKVKEGRGYISQDTHNEELNDMKQNYNLKISELQDQVQKYKNLEDGLRAKIKSQDERFEGMKLYYEDQIKLLSVSST